MKIDYRNLTKEQRLTAVQRLTALWAFTESGLGGIMHALQVPFTGLFVGGMALVMICLIAKITEHDFRQVLTSAVIVLIVKAMVSPHTPFPAYVAVAFQALLGYSLFSLLGVNFVSILLLSTISMVESAIQKILVLTLFFGASLWKAMDSMVDFLTSQFKIAPVNGSYWIVGIYLCIYLAGGVLIAFFSFRSIKQFYSGQEIPGSEHITFIDTGLQNIKTGKSGNRRLWALIGFVILLSAALFLFAPDKNTGWLAVIRTISWTASAIFIWYALVSPLLTKFIKEILKKKENKYNEEVLRVLSFLPVLRKLTTFSWQQSRYRKGIRRWYLFITLLIHMSLTYSETVSLEISPGIQS